MPSSHLPARIRQVARIDLNSKSSLRRGSRPSARVELSTQAVPSPASSLRQALARASSAFAFLDRGRPVLSSAVAEGASAGPAVAPWAAGAEAITGLLPSGF